ncbi:unnamed protein product [Phaeothamnion confervicola]
MKLLFSRCKRGPIRWLLLWAAAAGVSAARNTTSHQKRQGTFGDDTECGNWQAEYAQLHADILSGNLPPRYLVSVALEAGIADRLAGAVTQFYLAVFGKRAFMQLSYGDLPGFDAACDSPYIDWKKYLALPDSVVDPLKYTYKGRRGYTGDRSYSKSVDPKKFYPLYMVNKQVDFFKSADLTAFPPGRRDVEYVVSSSNRGGTFSILNNNPHHKHAAEKMGLAPDVGFACAFYYLCQPNAAVRQYYKPFWDLLRRPGVLKIGIQIRLGDETLDEKERHSDADLLRHAQPFFDCASRVEKAFATPGQEVVWYFISDSGSLRKAAQRRYGDKKLISDTDLHVDHVDCKMHDPKKCSAARADASMQHAVGEMVTFSLADYHVYTLESGFGRLGALLSGGSGNLYPISGLHGVACDPHKPATVEEVSVQINNYLAGV